MVNLTAVELGKTIGRGIAESNSYRQDFIETEETTDINLVAVQTINTVGSYFVYQNNLGILGLMSTSILPSLVSYLRLDETSGSTLTCSISSSTATTTNAEFVIGGKIRNGIRFEGLSQYPTASLANATLTYLNTLAPFTQAYNFTISLWLNLLDYDVGYGSGIFGSYQDMGFQNIGNNLQFGIRSGASVSSSTIISGMSTNTWYHLVATHSASGNTWSAYINGSLVATSTAVATFTCDNWRLGEVGALTGNLGTANKIIDEVAVWSRALAASEILNLYNTGTGAQYATGTTSLWNYYPLVLDHPVYAALNGASTYIDGDFISSNLVTSGIL